MLAEKMKITGSKTELPAIASSKLVNTSRESDLLPKPPHSRKPPRRRPKSSGNGVRLKKEAGAPAGKRSRPETPLLRWKFDEEIETNGVSKEEKSLSEVGRKCERKGRVPVSSRKLAAAIWRFQLPEVPNDRSGKLGFQAGIGNFGLPFDGDYNNKVLSPPAKDLVESPHSVTGPRKGYMCKLRPTHQFSNSAMEGVTKWDPVGWKASDDIKHLYGESKPHDNRTSAASVISALEAELEQARSRIHELEAERRSSKKKIEQFLRKVSEERTAWRSREHDKIRAIIDDIKTDLSRERKNRQRLEIVNSKLVNELTDAKLSAKRYMQDYEKERKARELIEEVCDELAKEIGEDKAEVEALQRESMKLREEVDEERKMLQMAEVWREERVQMKLVDAKVTLEEKFSYMTMLICELESFLSSRGATPDLEEMRKAQLLRQAAASLNIQDFKEFTYEPPNSDDIFSVFEDGDVGEVKERQIEPCLGFTPPSNTAKIHTVSPEVNGFNKDNMMISHPNAFGNRSEDLEEDGSEWETVSHLEDQGSSYSPGGSDPSVNNNRRNSNASRSGTEWEGNAGERTPITEISEVCPIPNRQLKKTSSISRLWRSCPNNGENYKIVSIDGVKGRLSNGRLSNGAIISPDHGSGTGGFSPSDLGGQWSSPDSGNPHITRGIKGCIEWPRTAQKNSLKSKLLEARMESQKVQLRQVLKQKI